MYVYINSEPGLWTVGFYDPSGNWHSESDHDDREAAARRVAWLNSDYTYATAERAQVIQEGSDAHICRRNAELTEDGPQGPGYYCNVCGALVNPVVF